MEIARFETFYGHIDTRQDALCIFDACVNGTMRKVSRRLDFCEKNKIRSGSVFVFDENSSNIRRWTDGRQWVQTRLEGNFLIYNEVLRVKPTEEQLREATQKYLPGRRIIVTNRGTFQLKENGLVKKTISLEVRGQKLHLISYYRQSDVERKTLPSPPRNEIPPRISNEVMVERTLMGMQRAKEALSEPSNMMHTDSRSEASSISTRVNCLGDERLPSLHEIITERAPFGKRCAEEELRGIPKKLNFIAKECLPSLNEVITGRPSVGQRRAGTALSHVNCIRPMSAPPTQACHVSIHQLLQHDDHVEASESNIEKHSNAQSNLHSLYNHADRNSSCPTRTTTPVSDDMDATETLLILSDIASSQPKLSYQNF